MSDSSRRRRRPIRPGKLFERRNGIPTTPGELFRIFKEERILERTAAGEISSRLVYDEHPSAPKAEEPFCTKSQLLAYYTTAGQKIAEAHQYLRTDGSIGASGMPDPKEVVHSGSLYYLDG